MIKVSKALRLARRYATSDSLITGGIGQNYVWENRTYKVVFAREHAYSDLGRLFVTTKATGKTKEIGG